LERVGQAFYNSGFFMPVAPHWRHDTLYAAISTGILKASSVEPFLANYENWEFEANIPTAPLGVLDIEFFIGNMFINVLGEHTDVIWRKQPNSTVWEVFAEYENMKYNEVWSNEEWLCLAGSGAYQVYHFELNQNLNGVGHAGVGVNANAVIMDKLYAGLGYRNQDAMSIMLGYQIMPSLRASYSYDLTTSSLSAYSSGSHELFLTYCFTIEIPPRINGSYRNPRFL
jgi:hypothetical protein